MRQNGMVKGLSALVAFLGLAACVDTTSMGSEAYVEGWRMGCYSGYTDAGVNWYWGLAHNTPKFGENPDYQPAWYQGYATCFDAVLSGQPAWRTLPESVAYPPPDPGLSSMSVARSSPPA